MDEVKTSQTFLKISIIFELNTKLFQMIDIFKWLAIEYPLSELAQNRYFRIIPYKFNKCMVAARLGNFFLLFALQLKIYFGNTNDVRT